MFYVVLPFYWLCKVYLGNGWALQPAIAQDADNSGLGQSNYSYSSEGNHMFT